MPAGSATTQVNEAPVKPDQEKRAGEEGLFPGTTLCTDTGDQLNETIDDRGKPTKKKGPGERRVSIASQGNEDTSRTYQHCPEDPN